MLIHVLDAISPIDGRYRKRYTQPLADHFSERALMRNRVIVEAEYFVDLGDEPGVGMRVLSAEERNQLFSLTRLPLEDAEIIKAIETNKDGWGPFKRTNHDVKAVELFLRHKLSTTSMTDLLEWLHFALTSEDINNISYAMMLTGGVKILLASLEELEQFLTEIANMDATVAMQARSHGQPASPTTVGKEFRVFQERLGRQVEQLRNYSLLVKLNGATGNYNAHVAAYPHVDWIKFTGRFVERLNNKYSTQFEVNYHTTQIEPHDTYAELFAILSRINVILLDFCQDTWRYISDSWIVQKPVEGETGSSTMPNKVNPIKFENAEGNMGMANALFGFFSSMLPISRLQRHLSDSTVIRNFGVAFAHCLVSYRYIIEGLAELGLNHPAIEKAIQDHPEVLAEAYQTILRREGIANAYERLRVLTRGKEVSMQLLHEFVDGIDELNDDVKAEMKLLLPRHYIGLAVHLASRTVP